jgi:hypothetical protein
MIHGLRRSVVGEKRNLSKRSDVWRLQLHAKSPTYTGVVQSIPSQRFPNTKSPDTPIVTVPSFLQVANAYPPNDPDQRLLPQLRAKKGKTPPKNTQNMPHG